MLSTFDSYRDVLRENRRPGNIVASAWIVVGAVFTAIILFV